MPAGTRRVVAIPDRGAWGGPVEVVDAHASAEALGAAVREALRASTTIARDAPTEAWEQAMLTAGVNPRLIERRRGASVERRSDGNVEVTPEAWQRGKWIPLPKLAAQLVAPSDEALGRTIRDAF